MKALFEKIVIREQSSLLIRRFQLAYFDAPWHYHPEYELTYIVKGHGLRFVGDHVELFQAGDLVLLGPNLPHFWRNDDEFYQPDSTQLAESIVVQFPASFDELGLVNVPEASAVRRLLQRARYGLRFSTLVSQSVASTMKELVRENGFSQLLSLLHLLHDLANDRDAYLLASNGYQLSPGTADTERMKRVLEFLLESFRQEIRIEEIASVAGMVPAAFCRYFKKRTRKSFVEYVNELRISHARKLLTESDLSVGQVSLDCGYNNNSHFHRQFKIYTGMTPLHYQTIAREK